jgi:hypothetical protein
MNDDSTLGVLERERLENEILDYLARARGRDHPVFGIADFHSETMGSLFPSEEGRSQRAFSNRALYDEALDELLDAGYVERREGGRLFLTEKGQERIPGQ